MTHNLIILGAGMSGLTAAVFAGQEKLAPTVVTGERMHAQLPLIREITNFSGFDRGIRGADLLSHLSDQATRFGARLLPGRAVAVDLRERPFRVTLDDGGVLSTKALVIATGTFPKPLGVASESRLQGKGIYSSTLDIADRYRDKTVFIVGGGNSAMGEALEMAKHTTKIRLIYEGALYASPTLVDKVRGCGVEILEQTKLSQVHGEQFLTGVTLERGGALEQVAADALFVCNGRPANSELFRGQLEMDSEGVIQIKRGKTATSVEGVFAVGDVCRPLKYRKLLAAAGDGTEAAIDVKEYLMQAQAQPKGRLFTPKRALLTFLALSALKCLHALVRA